MREEYHREAFAEDKLLAEDRSENYRGTVRVGLRRLAFAPEYSRQIDRKNVERLKKIFSRPGGCLRLSPPNCIPAVIDQQDLDLAIQSTGTTLEALLGGSEKEPPMLKLAPDYLLQCLHGQHRILAALEVLEPRDEWWTVHLYLSALSPDARTALSEDYTNSLNFADGEIYRKVRFYQARGRQFPESRWRAYLSKDKQKDLRRLLKRGDYTNALDKLRFIHGLWAGFSFGKVHWWLDMRCREESLHYLEHIWTTFSKALDGDRKLMRRTDNRTVKALELRAPGSSSDDVKVLRRLLENGTLFSTVDLEKREAIWKRLLSLEGILIPSLYTFFEDLKFLRVPEKIMKSLIEPPFKGSLYEMMEQHFTGANQSSHEIHFQDPETTFKLSPAQLIECGYQQLLLYPQRNFRKMIGECPRKEKDRPKPIIMEPDPVAWHKYASLASRLGFDSPAIRRLMADDPYKKYARASLQKSCLSESYTFDEVAFESCVEKIASTLATATKKSPHPVTPALVTDGVGEDLPRRCGRFFETAYDQDRELLFLETLNSTFQNQRGKSITSFFVRRCVYFAFFGEQFTQAGFNTTATPEPAPVAPAASNDRTSSHPITGALVVEGVQEQQSSTTTTGDQEVSAHMQPSSSRDLVVVEQGSANAETESLYSPPSRIFFRIYKNGGVEDQNQTLPYDANEVKRVAFKYERKGFSLWNVTGSRRLTPDNCFDAIVADGSCTIVLVPDNMEDINRLRITYGAGADAVAGSDPEASQKRRQITGR